MQEEHGIIGKILAKYPMITDEEQQVLDGWLAKNGNRQKFELIIDNEKREIDLNRFLQIKKRKETNRERYHQAISNLSTNNTLASIVWWKKWPTYVAAASILFAVSLIGYKWFRGSNHEFEKGKPVVVQNKTADVAPGQYKAKLTLADGSVVTLDSFSRTRIVQQGRTNVYTKDGKLIYQNKGKEKEVLYNTLTTAKGETFGMVLSDGSKVWLNSQSSLRYPVAFNGDVRKVEITGEAYFEVARAMRQTFKVVVDNMEVEVLGTHFNVNAYTDEDAIKTTLLEGKVQIVSGGTSALLRPGQQVQLKKGTTLLQVRDDADVEQAVAWKNGYFQFDDDDLKTVMRQLARWYDVEVIYQSGVGPDTYGGRINRNSKASEVLTLLERNRVHFKIEGKKIIVTR